MIKLKLKLLYGNYTKTKLQKKKKQAKLEKLFVNHITNEELVHGIYSPYKAREKKLTTRKWEIGNFFEKGNSMTNK